MTLAVLLFLILLWVLGYVQIPFLPFLDITLFTLLGKTITLYDLLLFALMVWAIDLLPGPFRAMASVVLLLWVLAFFGIIAITGFSEIIVLALIIGLIVYLFTGGKKLF